MADLLTNLTPPDRAEIRRRLEEEHEQLARKQAARYTRGSTRIQRDALVVKDDLERRLQASIKRNADG